MGAVCAGTGKSYDYNAALAKDVTNQYTVEIDDEQQPGNQSKIYRNSDHVDGFDPEIPNSVWGLINTSWTKNPNATMMKYRPFKDDGTKRGEFVDKSYTECIERIEHISAGLRSELGLKKQDTVGIFSKNRPEWMFIHLANQRLGYQTVALYDTLGEEAVAYIMSHAETSVICCEVHSIEAVLMAHQNTQDDEELTPCLKTIVVFDYDDWLENTHEQVTQRVREQIPDGIRLIGISELEEIGTRQPPTFPEDVASFDVCFLMYTSGTTGNPKGVRLCHRGFCQIAYGVLEIVELNQTDRHVSYLPLAHIFECLVETVMFTQGGSVAYYQGDIKKLTDDWKAIKPTIVCGVPRVFEKVYGKVMATIEGESWFKKKLIKRALAAGKHYSVSGQRSGIWDKLVFSKLAAKMGFEECKLVLSGAAPLPPYLAEFLRVVLINGRVAQGYGMTECTGAACVTRLDDFNLGHVGVPMPGVDIRLEDIPSMNYSHNNTPPTGEVLVRCDGVMDGYYKNPKKTAETIIDGWLHTGDVGRINPNGTLSIIDRKKNIFKLGNGEYIAVEKIEGVYGKAGAVNQIWVYGNSYKSFIVAVVVPNGAWARDLLVEKGKWKKSESVMPYPSQDFSDAFSDYCEAYYDIVKQAVLTEMRDYEGSLKRFEKVKDIHLECNIDPAMAQGFTVENGLNTPTFKLKRPQCLIKYIEPIQALYTMNGEPPKPQEYWLN